MEAVRNPGNQWPALGTLLVRDGAVTPRAARAGSRQATRRGRTSASARSCSPRVRDPSRDLARPGRAARARVRRTRPAIDRHLARASSWRRAWPAAIALPIRFLEDGSVLVAVADPTNVMSSDELRLAVGMPIRICVARRSAIELAITTLNDPASCPESRSSSATHSRPRTPRAFSTSTTTRPPSSSSTAAISKALDIGASDIHFTPQQRRVHVRVRVDGVMRELTSIPGTQATAVVSRLKIMGGLDIAERRAPQDGRVSIKRGEESLDVRMAILPTTYGEKVTSASCRRAST